MSESEKRVVRENVAKWQRDRKRRAGVAERRKFNRQFNQIGTALTKVGVS